jgi:vitamin K-dependent gamma-carboxylase-like protein
VVAGAIGLFVLLAALFALWDTVAPPVVAALAGGETLGPLDALFEAHRTRDPARRDVAWYVRNGRTAVGRAVILAAAAALATIAVVRRRQVVAATRAYFGASGAALNLAVFRIVFFAVLIQDVAWTPTPFYARLPAVLQRPPPGLGWLPELLPITPAAVHLVRLAFWVSGILAMLGLFTRPACVIALVTGAYVLAVPQLFKVYADVHLLWFAALLAVSPCADVLSLDAFRARRSEPPPPSRAYALPLRFVWLLIAAIYFFPGFWKLWVTGLGWVSAENMQHHMFQKWHEFGDWTPALRVDRVPALLFLGALGTVAFELGFVALVLSRRLRPLAAAAGLAFHNLTWLFFGISFWFLQLAYVALIDWAALLRRPRAEAAATRDDRVPWATAMVGSLLLAGVVATGTRLVQILWPFMLYPTFASVEGTTRVQLTVRAVDATGRERDVDLRRLNDVLPERFEPARLYGLVDRMIGDPEPERSQKLRALWTVLAPGDPTLRTASGIRFYRETVSVVPDRRHEAPLERELVLQLDGPRTPS